MSSSSKTNPGRTNQKLYFARLQQDLLQQALAEGRFDAEARALACREASIYHLHGAYVAFLQELCRFYKLPLHIDSSEALRLAMAAKGQVSPEVTQLQQWESDSGSWLAQLLQALAAQQRAEEAVVVKPAGDEGEEQGDELESPVAAPRLLSGINIVQTDVDLPLSEPDLARLSHWHQALTQAIREFRREMMEW